MPDGKYNCQSFPYKKKQEQTIEITPEQDDYAFFHSSAFEAIFGQKKRESGEYTVPGYLKLSNGKKSVYLKYRRIAKATKSQVVLTYSNRCLLGIDPKLCNGCNDEATVTVSKASWLAYNWNNRDLTERWNFRAAVAAVIALLVMDIPQFIISLIQLF